MRPRGVSAQMDGASQQRQRTSMWSQGSRGGINAESSDAMMIPTRSVAPSDIDVSSRRVRPRILHAVGKGHRAALDQRRVLYVRVILGKLRTDGRIECDFGRWLSVTQCRCEHA